VSVIIANTTLCPIGAKLSFPLTSIWFAEKAGVSSVTVAVGESFLYLNLRCSCQESLNPYIIFVL